MGVTPGYKQSDMGVIPESWEITTLGALGSTFGGLSGKTKSDFGRGAARYITFMNVMANVTIDREAFELVDVKPLEIQNEVAKGDLFFNGSSETPGEVGLCALLVHDVQGVFLNSFCFGFRLRDGAPADGLYIAYYFRSPAGRELVKSLAQGAIRYNLSKTALLRTRFPLPQRVEQEAIAWALRDADALIASLEQLLAKKRQVKRGAMQELLTGRKRLLGFRGKWDVAPLDHVAERITGVWGAADFSPEHPTSVNVIRAGDITQDGVLTGSAERFVSHSELSKACCRLDDVVMTTSGNGLGKVWWSDGRPNVVASNFVRILRPIRGKSHGRYLSYVLRSEVGLKQLQEHTATSAYPNLRPSFFTTAWPSLPPISEQGPIAAILSDMDDEVAALETKLAKARQVKQGMMHELLTGRIRLA